jgi:hypothetical protein
VTVCPRAPTLQFFMLGQYHNSAPVLYHSDIEEMMENIRYEIVSLENKCVWPAHAHSVSRWF